MGHRFVTRHYCGLLRLLGRWECEEHQADAVQPQCEKTTAMTVTPGIVSAACAWRFFCLSLPNIHPRNLTIWGPRISPPWQSNRALL